MTENATTSIEELSGLEALGFAISYLLIHLIIGLTIGIIFACIGIAALGRTGSLPMGWTAAAKSDFWNYALYCCAFSMFGIATAYFISLGLKKNDDATNSLLVQFVPPFIALLTGGVAFVATKTRANVANNELVLGVLCFLAACVLSYQTFTGQIGEVTAGNLPEVPAPNNQSTADTGGLTPPQPSDGQANSANSSSDEEPPAAGLEPPRRN